MLQEFVFRMLVGDLIFEEVVRAYSAGEAMGILEARYGAGTVAGLLSQRYL
jgi:hypothetical protein